MPRVSSNNSLNLPPVKTYWETRWDIYWEAKMSIFVIHRKLIKIFHGKWFKVNICIHGCSFLYIVNCIQGFRNYTVRISSIYYLPEKFHFIFSVILLYFIPCIQSHMHVHESNVNMRYRECNLWRSKNDITNNMY